MKRAAKLSIIGIVDVNFYYWVLQTSGGVGIIEFIEINKEEARLRYDSDVTDCLTQLQVVLIESMAVTVTKKDQHWSNGNHTLISMLFLYIWPA